MSLIHYSSQTHGSACVGIAPSQPDDRYKRDPVNDLKEGIDLVFELKAKLDKFHPIARETLIRLML